MMIKLRWLIFTLLLAGLAPASGQTVKPVKMRMLVLSGDGSEPGFGAIRFFLDSLGAPYDAVVLKTTPLPALSDTAHTLGSYQGIIFSTTNLAYDGKEGLTAEQWAAVEAYMVEFKVRALAYYGWPQARYGMTPAGSVPASAAVTRADLTAAAAGIFPYMNRNNGLPIQNAYIYLTQPMAASGETTTPLIEIRNRGTVAVLHTKPDGREYIALSFDNAWYLQHSQLVNFGLINWLTKGLFLGYRKIYLNPQMDDLFLPNDLFVLTKPACQPVGQLGLDPTYDPTANGCPEYRLDDKELDQIKKWQDDWRKKALTRDFQVSIAFNGFGTTADSGVNPKKDRLPEKATSFRKDFIWLNHTFDHENLDCFAPAGRGSLCVPATYGQSYDEIAKNTRIGRDLELSTDAASMVTPNISGLGNAEFLRAAKTLGIRYLVSDTSLKNFLPQRPNEGVYDPIEKSILLIPRRATSLYYNTITPQAGVAGSLVDEYNLFYGPGGLFKLNGVDWFSTRQTYAQILDRESDTLLNYMLRYEIYPTMYHQSNFANYQGRLSLFTDLIDAALAKYGKYMNIPVVTLTQSQIGQEAAAWMTYNAAGVSGILYPGQGMILSAQKTARIPVTGICKTGCEQYGGQPISYFQVSGGSSVTVKLP